MFYSWVKPMGHRTVQFWQVWSGPLIQNSKTQFKVPELPLLDNRKKAY